jgi:hypothetical protein
MAGLLCKELMIRGDEQRQPSAEQNLLIASLDHLSRTEELQALLRATDWDLVVTNEARRMSAHPTGGEIRPVVPKVVISTGNTLLNATACVAFVVGLACDAKFANVNRCGASPMSRLV